jgi:hypothetical protein
MRVTIVTAVLLLLALSLVTPFVSASADVNDREISAIAWLKGQAQSKLGFAGFARGTSSPWNHTIFVEDQALIALALSDYHATHYDSTYDGLLKTALAFIMAARVNRGDFFEYYDTQTGAWHHVGGLYQWDAYTIAGTAAAAYKIVSADLSQLSYWFPIVYKLEASLSSFDPSERSDGAWLFGVYGTTKQEALTRENALLLVGILYLGLFENSWGSGQRATNLGLTAERTARWLLSMQSDNSTSAYGGFPHSDANSTQVSEENGEILLGVNTYYSLIGVLLQNPSPTIWDARASMANWVRGFVVNMMDNYGGIYNARNANVTLHYPKTSFAAAWVMQAVADIWINIGDIGPGNIPYRNVTQYQYDWLTGQNELSTDLQGAQNIAGTSGGFYSGISTSGLNRLAATGTVAAVIYALDRAQFIRIPEFPGGAERTLLILTVIFVLASSLAKKQSEPAAA